MDCGLSGSIFFLRSYMEKRSSGAVFALHVCYLMVQNLTCCQE
jgi:hypothetical protein